jgi:hypothetical protein
MGRVILEHQLSIAWRLLDLHLTDLAYEECFWRPAGHGPHVYEHAGVWRADWPETEAYDAGPASIAWLTWHIGFWWTMVLDHSFGEGTLRREDVEWPGSVESTRAWLTDLHDEWVVSLGNLSDAELRTTGRTRWPFSDRPFHSIAGWLNLELMKNAAEIGYCRFLYASRQDRSGSPVPLGPGASEQRVDKRREGRALDEDQQQPEEQ